MRGFILMAGAMISGVTSDRLQLYRFRTTNDRQIAERQAVFSGLSNRYVAKPIQAVNIPAPEFLETRVDLAVSLK